AVSGDGRRAASGGSGEVLLWDTATMARRGALKGTLLGFAEDGRVLATVADGAVRFWDASGGKPRERSAVQGVAGDALALSPDGKTLACRVGDSGIRLWDLGKPTAV